MLLIYGTFFIGIRGSHQSFRITVSTDSGTVRIYSMYVHLTTYRGKTPARCRTRDSISHERQHAVSVVRAAQPEF
jgi:hypothetical protein